MNCPEVQERLTDYAVGETSPVENGEVEKHVTACSACAGTLVHLRRAIDLLRRGDWGTDAAALTVERRLAVEARAAAGRSRPTVFRQVSVAATIAILAVGLGALMLTSVSRPSEDGWPSPVTVNPALDSRAVEPPAPPPPPRVSSKEVLDRLRALGYVAPNVVTEGIEDGVGGGVSGGVSGGVVGGVIGGPGQPSYYNSPPGPTRRPHMFFEPSGTNPFVDTHEDPLSTFGLDVDTASYTLARSFLRRGALPPPSAVRVEEFVNAVTAADVPEPARTLTIRLEGAPNPLHPGYHVLRIGLRARDVSARDRKHAVLTFVIDVSGSMAMENRLELVKRSLRLLVERLEERDRIGIVVYGTRGRVVLEPTPVSSSSEIGEAIDSLAPEGSTNLGHGLTLGYRMAARAFDPAATNRVILCTDGVANNGVTDAEKLLQGIRRRADQGIAMTALGFGMGNYNDALLQKLADGGDGQYAYIDDFFEAKRFFLRDIAGVLQLVARDAKAQVEFDAGRVERYRLLGYEKRDVADQDFRNDTVDGGELNAGHAVTVLYELKLAAADGPLGAVRVRYQDPETREPTEAEATIDGSVFRNRFDEASPRFRTAYLAARLAEHLRNSRWVKGERLASVLRLAEAYVPADDSRAVELLDLARRAAALTGPVER